MGVEYIEVEFACGEDDDGAHGLETAVATGFPFRGLDEAVEGFEEAVGLSGARPGGDAVEVLALRWNGSIGSEIGNPKFRGLATWFVVPNELEPPVRDAISALLGARRRS